MLASVVLVCILKISPIYILVCIIAVAAFISWHATREKIAGDGKDEEKEGKS